jgi:hypothetical protein
MMRTTSDEKLFRGWTIQLGFSDGRRLTFPSSMAHRHHPPPLPSPPPAPPPATTTSSFSSRTAPSDAFEFLKFLPPPPRHTRDPGVQHRQSPLRCLMSLSCYIHITPMHSEPHNLRLFVFFHQPKIARNSETPQWRGMPRCLVAAI